MWGQRCGVRFMPSKNRLFKKTVEHAKAGKHYDGGGLFLRVDKTGTGRWVFRFRQHGRQREMGLGSRESISLADVRKERDRWASFVAQGHDPIRQREIEAQARSVEPLTLETVALACFDARKTTLKGDGNAGRWLSPVRLHVFPKLGKKPIEEVNQNDIVDALSPIWKEKAVTARKAINRLGLIMTHGAAIGLDVDLLAIQKAKALLGAQDHKVKHIASMPWREVPTFYDSLEGEGMVAECLRFIIMTVGPRSAPARNARWSDIDLDGQIWTVRGEDMKGQKGKTDDFRVPLSNGAMSILQRVKPFERDGLVFPSPRKGCISDMATGRLMQRRGLEYRPHGFRSSFRDWCEHVGVEYIVAEMCLAHTVGGRVERAYRRDDLLEKRAVAMQRWSDHCNGIGSARVLNMVDEA